MSRWILSSSSDQRALAVVDGIGILPGGRDEERSMHREYARWRVEWEWFALSHEQIEAIEDRCEQSGWLDIP